jgi:hypothetical protein
MELLIVSAWYCYAYMTTPGFRLLVTPTWFPRWNKEV